MGRVIVWNCENHATRCKIPLHACVIRCHGSNSRASHTHCVSRPRRTTHRCDRPRRASLASLRSRRTTSHAGTSKLLRDQAGMLSDDKHWMFSPFVTVVTWARLCPATPSWRRPCFRFIQFQTLGVLGVGRMELALRPHGVRARRCPQGRLRWGRLLLCQRRVRPPMLSMRKTSGMASDCTRSSGGFGKP